VIPRILARSGTQTAIRLKRFHSYGLGESHVDQLLTGVEELVPYALERLRTGIGVDASHRRVRATRRRPRT